MTKELRNELIDTINYYEKIFQREKKEETLNNFRNKHLLDKPKTYTTVDYEYIIDLYEELLGIYYSDNDFVYINIPKVETNSFFNITNNASSSIIYSCDCIELNSIIPSIFYNLLKMGKMKISIPGMGEIYKVLYEYYQVNKLLSVKILLNYFYGICGKSMLLKFTPSKSALSYTFRYDTNALFDYYNNIIDYIKMIHKKVYYIDTDTIYVDKASDLLINLEKYGVKYFITPNKKMLFIDKKKTIEYDGEWKIVNTTGIRH